MFAYKFIVLNELTAFALISLALALVWFAIVRHRSPQLDWHTRGKVKAAQYDVVDFVVVGALLLLFLSPIFFPEVAQPEAEPKSPQESTTGGKPNPYLNFARQLLAQAFILGCLFLYLTVGRAMNLVDIFGLNRMKFLKALLVSCGFFIPILLLVYGSAEISVRLFPDGEAQNVVKELSETEDRRIQWTLMFSAVVLAPIWEEFIFRGFLYAAVKRFTERIYAAIFTGLIFGIIHMHVPSVLPLWVLGILLALAYEWTGSLLIPILLHALFNGFNTLRILMG